MAIIVKTPSGKWKAVVRLRGWPTAAKTFDRKRDAEDWADRTSSEMRAGVFVCRRDAERLLFKDAMQRYLQEVTPSKKETSQRSDRLKSKMLLESFGDYSLAAISAELVAKYRDKRLAMQSQRVLRTVGKPTLVRPATVRLELALLSHLFAIAIREWHIGLVANPVANVRKPSVGAGRDRRLSQDEQTKLFEALDAYANPMLGWIACIALETGMRSSEITGLTLSQVDTHRRIARLTDTKNNDARTVPLSKAATETFRLAIDNRVRPPDTSLIFFGEPGRDGVRRPYEFNRAWNKIKHDLGMGDLRFHDLRHEAVSRLVEAGLSDQEVAAISGHKSMQMLRRYTHLRAEDLVRKLDELNNR